MRNLPHIVILLASYNGIEHIDEQLNSILNQDHTDWSLWVSDDCSTDGTVEKIHAFAEQNPTRDIRVMQGPRKGAAANFLHLICHPDLHDHHIAICDQDDIWWPQKLSLALRALSQVKGPAVYSAQSEHITANGTHIKNSRIHNGTPSFGNALVQNRVAGHCATLNPAAVKLLRTTGPVDVPFHDWWIYLLISGCGGKIIISHDIVLSYRQHSKNVLGGNQRVSASLSRIFSVLRGSFSVWVNKNQIALRSASHLLTPKAKQTLGQWEKAPKRGVRRARVLLQLKMVRDTGQATKLLLLACLLGRF